MRKLLLFLVLALFVGVWQINAQTQQRVTVKVNHQKNIGKDFSIKFAELVSDSRCPADVRCIWAGNAKLKIKLSRQGKSQIFEINTGMKPQIVNFAGYEIKVVSLEPRIRRNIRINRNAYTATFSITKIETTE